MRRIRGRWIFSSRISLELYQKLPRHSPGDLEAMRNALAQLRSFDLRAMKYPRTGAEVLSDDGDGLVRLERFLRDLERLLPSWSNNLSSNYFSLARTFPVTIGQ